MKVSISSLFAEPGCFFSISYKVHLYIRDILNEKIIVPNNITEKIKDYHMSLMVSTNSQIKEVEVKGPSRDTRNKYLTWGLFLPYKEIVSFNDEREPYLKYFFEAIKVLLAKYDVTENEIATVESIVRQEILGNPEYYTEKEIFEEIDLSDLGLD